MAEKLLNARDLATLLQVSKTTAYQLMQTGEIAVVRMGKSVRVRERAYQEFLERKSDEALQRDLRENPTKRFRMVQ